MNIRYILGLLKQSMKSVLSAKLRNFLSSISIALGIAGLTIITSLGSASIEEVNNIMKVYGNDALMIFSGNIKKRPIGAKTRTINLKDMQGIINNFPDAYMVSPFRLGPNLIAASTHAKEFVEIDNVVSSYKKQWNWDVIKGRDLTQDDNINKLNVCAIGYEVDKDLFPNTDSIGQQIRLGKSSCTVIGVYEYKTISDNKFITLPDSVFTSKYAWNKQLIAGIRVRFNNPENMDKYENSIRQFLRFNHSLTPDMEDDFQIYSSKTISKMIFKIIGSIGAFLLVITLTITIVGGFVTANIFMLATQSRISEIGIRRAFGANQQDIFLQFIIEFLIIIFCGMVIGITIATAVIKLISSYSFIIVSITPIVLVITTISSIFIAITFGIIPAKNAASIKPIEAIRTL